MYTHITYIRNFLNKKDILKTGLNFCLKKMFINLFGKHINFMQNQHIKSKDILKLHTILFKNHPTKI